LYEDILFYDSVNDWYQISTFFDTILEEELSYGINEGELYRWHNGLQKYFQLPPSVRTRKGFFDMLELDEGADQEEVERVISEIDGNQDVKMILEGVVKLLDLPTGF
jgi:hypothetical protein